MEALTTLLDSGAAVTLTNSITGYTALHEAAAFGNREIVEHLLKNAKADANASDYKAVTPLMLASGSGYSIICEYLLQYGALVDSCSAEEMTALHFASANGDPRVAQQIIEAGNLSSPQPLPCCAGSVHCFVQDGSTCPRFFGFHQENINLYCLLLTQLGTGKLFYLGSG